MLHEIGSTCQCLRKLRPAVPTDPDLSKLLPSDDDQSTMKQLFAIHIARILCKHMPFFSEDFGDVIPEHIDHPMSSNVSQKSEVVSLNIQLLCNIHDFYL